MTTLAAEVEVVSTSRRWYIAGAAMLTHLCLGSVYAWSVFIQPLQKQTLWQKPQVTWAFSTAIAMLGLTAALSSRITQRLGPRKSVMLSSVFFATGLAGAGWAWQLHSLPVLYLVFGLIGGIGLGLGYAPPVTTLLRWFPDRRGLATGMAVSGFGFGALIASKLGPLLLNYLSCAQTFWTLAAIYGPLILIASLWLEMPPPAWKPLGYTPPESRSGKQGIDFSTAIRGLRFWLIWLIFFANISAGIMLVALASPMAQEIARFEVTAAATVVAIMGLFNGGGRLGWSAISDRLGRSRVFALMLVLQIGLFFTLQSSNPILFVASLWIIISCYGAGFALTPALIADTFGSRSAPALYGVALTAWSAAALISPPLAAQLHEQTHSYAVPLYAATGILGIAFLLNLILLWQAARPRPA